jgi:hypothetical protein
VCGRSILLGRLLFQILLGFEPCDLGLYAQRKESLGHLYNPAIFFADSLITSTIVFLIASPTTGPAFNTSFLKRVAANGVLAVSVVIPLMLSVRICLSASERADSSANSFAAASARSVHGNGFPQLWQYGVADSVAVPNVPRK